MKSERAPEYDKAFLAETASTLAALPHVRAVSLGGSRAQGTNRPDSDWDFAVYYDGKFDPQSLRQLGWAGYVSEVGEWGGGVFNGGAWLTIDGRRSDVHYRDLAAIEHELDRAGAGHFEIEPLMFHLAGIPTYLVLAELALSRVLVGELPAPGFPDALRQTAPERWWDRAARNFEYAINAHAPAGRLIECVGLLARAVAESSHAVLAARGEWVTNEKLLITRAGLRKVDAILADLDRDPSRLVDKAHAVCAACRAAVDQATDSDGEPDA